MESVEARFERLNALDELERRVVADDRLEDEERAHVVGRV
jgi:hypothetical protein